MWQSLRCERPAAIKQAAKKANELLDQVGLAGRLKCGQRPHPHAAQALELARAVATGRSSCFSTSSWRLNPAEADEACD